MYQTIQLEKKERVATITLNRPDKMNSITSEMQSELLQALDEVDADSDITVAILTGAGRAFCAGFDVATMRDTPEVFSMNDLLRIITLNKPIIAAVNGYALAQGFQLALACDIIVASEKAIFGSIGARIGEI